MTTPMHGESDLPAGLLDKVMLRIAEEQKRHVARVRAGICSFISMVALVALIPISQMLVIQLTASGFTHFISLIFSDTATVVIYWQDFALSLIESFPVLETSLVLFVVFSLILTLRYIAQDVETILKKSPRIMVS